MSCSRKLRTCWWIGRRSSKVQNPKPKVRGKQTISPLWSAPAERSADGALAAPWEFVWLSWMLLLRGKDQPADLQTESELLAFVVAGTELDDFKLQRHFVFLDIIKETAERVNVSRG